MPFRFWPKRSSSHRNLAADIRDLEAQVGPYTPYDETKGSLTARVTSLEQVQVDLIEELFELKLVVERLQKTTTARTPSTASDDDADAATPQGGIRRVGRLDAAPRQTTRDEMASQPIGFAQRSDRRNALNTNPLYQSQVERDALRARRASPEPRLPARGTTDNNSSTPEHNTRGTNGLDRASEQRIADFKEEMRAAAHRGTPALARVSEDSDLDDEDSFYA